jgi:triosephosphate isomerase
MLKSLGVSHVIVGHSERRAMGETDEAVNQKATLLLKEKLTPIICVGEKKRSDSGAHFEYVEAQLHRAFSGVAKAQVSRAVVAYEPVWAISSGDGRGQTATTADIREMKLFIQRVLADRYSRTTGMAVRVLYGGSVNADNAEELAREADVDGFLVGGASRKPADFLAIITATRTA